ncbi:MAG TPA: hypothetical protein PKM48_15410, partial [Parvularculaceae bacterium]|nr:hypothetical protein [Parvularculaceae bacterium]
MAKDELVFLPLGGSGEIGMNMNLYGFGPPHNRKWIMIDCGVMFGDLGQGLVLLLTGLGISVGKRFSQSLRQAGLLIVSAGLSAAFFGLVFGSF